MSNNTQTQVQTANKIIEQTEPIYFEFSTQLQEVLPDLRTRFKVHDLVLTLLQKTVAATLERTSGKVEGS